MLTSLSGDHSLTRMPLGGPRALVALGGRQGKRSFHRDVGYVFQKPLEEAEWLRADLLKAFTWQCQRDAVGHAVLMPNCGPLPMRYHTWPEYGFDEFFLAVAAYPRLAQDGMLTFLPGRSSSQLMIFDIEYVTWGNPSSEVFYFASGSCC